MDRFNNFFSGAVTGFVACDLVNYLYVGNASVLMPLVRKFLQVAVRWVG